MPLLSTATKVYAGASPALKVYQGSSLIWPSAPSGPQVVFSAGGSNTTSTTTAITIPGGVAASTTLFFMKNQAGGVTVSDPAVTLLTQATVPSTNRMQIYNCDTATKSFTLTYASAVATWFVVGMDSPRVGAAAFGGGTNSTSGITGTTLAAAAAAGDIGVGFYAINGTTPGWTTPALASQTFKQTSIGNIPHCVAGITAPLAAAGSVVLGDADRELEGTARMEFSGVALFHKGEP